METVIPLATVGTETETALPEVTDRVLALAARAIFVVGVLLVATATNEFALMVTVPTVAVGLALAEGLAEALGFGVALAVGDGVALAVGDGVALGEGLADGDGETSGVGDPPPPKNPPGA